MVTLCGLANIGATCYLNTLVQCLWSSVLFRKKMHDLQSLPPTKPLSIVKELMSIFQMFDEQRAYVVIRPERLVFFMQKVFDYLNIRSQNDIYEIYTLLVQRICDETLISVDNMIHAPINGPRNFEKIAHRCNKAWSKYFEKEYSQCTDLCYGQQISQIVCGHCKHIHINYQPFAVWEVPLPREGDIALEDAFSNSMLPETLTEWKCSECKMTSPSERTIKLWKFPQLFVVCLKRFQHVNGVLVKNNVHVDIPQVIEMFPLNLAASSEKGVTYTLRSLAVHHGDLHYGHYYAMVSNGDKWFRVDDDVVQTSPFNDRFAYMCFFERQT